LHFPGAAAATGGAAVPFFMINYSNEQKVNNGRCAAPVLAAAAALCGRIHTHNFYSNTPTEQLQFNGDLNFSPL
jgi:hypothetical protein